MAKKNIAIRPADNGYVVGEWDGYSTLNNSMVFTNFLDVLEYICKRMEHPILASTIRQSEALTKSLTEICEIAVAPKLLAIQAQVNPGAENVVSMNVDDIGF